MEIYSYLPKQLLDLRFGLRSRLALCSTTGLHHLCYTTFCLVRAGTFGSREKPASCLKETRAAVSSMRASARPSFFSLGLWFLKLVLKFYKVATPYPLFSACKSLNAVGNGCHSTCLSCLFTNPTSTSEPLLSSSSITLSLCWLNSLG